jgi:hypothetical protein
MAQDSAPMSISALTPEASTRARARGTPHRTSDPLTAYATLLQAAIEPYADQPGPQRASSSSDAFSDDDPPWPGSPTTPATAWTGRNAHSTDHRIGKGEPSQDTVARGVIVSPRSSTATSCSWGPASRTAVDAWRLRGALRLAAVPEVGIPRH